MSSSTKSLKVRKIGIELEIPLTKPDYSPAEFEDVENLFNQLVGQGWRRKFDPNTGALSGVHRTTEKGLEVVDTELGICTLEVALAPVNCPQDARQYWGQFKSEVLLPLINRLNLKILGYGNQPKSSNFKKLIAKKGHYQIYNWMFSPGVREWFWQNFPGLASVQFNFEIPVEKALPALNVFLNLSPLMWAASNNDCIAAESLLPYKSQRYFAYTQLAGKNLTDRYGTPKHKFHSLCDYINRMWNLPIFEIIRNQKCLRPAAQSLTTNQFILWESAKFVALNHRSSIEKISLDDLKTGIYFSWLDFRLKFQFHQELNLHELAQTVHSRDENCLIQMIDYILLEVRPISMQSHEQELDWMLFTYLILENLDAIAEDIASWDYQDVLTAVVGAQTAGLDQTLKGQTLGKIGLNLLKLIAHNQSEYPNQELLRLHSQLAQHCSPGDILREIFQSHGLQAVLEYITIKKESSRNNFEVPTKLAFK